MVAGAELMLGRAPLKRYRVGKSIGRCSDRLAVSSVARWSSSPGAVGRLPGVEDPHESGRRHHRGRARELEERSSTEIAAPGRGQVIAIPVPHTRTFTRLSVGIQWILFGPWGGRKALYFCEGVPRPTRDFPRSTAMVHLI